MRATDPPVQLVEVLRRFDLFRAIQPYRRGPRCKGDIGATFSMGSFFETGFYPGCVPLRRWYICRKARLSG